MTTESSLISKAAKDLDLDENDLLFAGASESGEWLVLTKNPDRKISVSRNVFQPQHAVNLLREGNMLFTKKIFGVKQHEWASHLNADKALFSMIRDYAEYAMQDDILNLVSNSGLPGSNAWAAEKLIEAIDTKDYSEADKAAGLYVNSIPYQVLMSFIWFRESGIKMTMAELREKAADMSGRSKGKIRTGTTGMSRTEAFSLNRKVGDYSLYIFGMQVDTRQPGWVSKVLEKLSWRYRHQGDGWRATTRSFVEEKLCTMVTS